MTVAVHPSAKTKRRIHVTEAVTAALIALAMIAVHLMFFFWPFRYRQVHPLLEQVFESKVTVSHYHRTYFPHPGFVAEGVTFYRHGDTRIPPLATVQRMTVKGQWGMLLFHPHLLYEIRLESLHVQIPPAGTKARGMDFDNGVIDTSESKLKIETICADGTVLDFLRHGDSSDPVQFSRTPDSRPRGRAADGLFAAGDDAGAAGGGARERQDGSLSDEQLSDDAAGRDLSRWKRRI